MAELAVYVPLATRLTIRRGVARLTAILFTFLMLSSGALPLFIHPIGDAGAESLPSWDKLFHLHDGGDYTTSVYDWMNSTGPRNPSNPDYDVDGIDGITIKKNVPPQRVHHWVLFPALDSDTVLSGDITAHVWARSRGNVSASLMTAIFYDVAPGDLLNTAAWVEIGRNTIPLSGPVYSDFQAYDLTVPAVNYTLAINHSFVLTMCRGDSLNDWLIVMFDQTAKDSFVSLRTETFMLASSAWTEDIDGYQRQVFTDLENPIACANISSTFGAYEILGANLTLSYQNGTIVPPLIVMSLTLTDPSSPPYWKVYSAVLPQLAKGSYVANITARDAGGSPTWVTCNFTVIGVDHFEVSAPPQVSSGELFSMSVKAMNSVNELLTDWVGAVHLAPYQLDMMQPGGGMFSIISASITVADHGQVNISNQTYSGGEEEQILIRASCGSYTGWSSIVVAHSGPVASISINPGGNYSCKAGESPVFAGTGYDANSNENLSWTPEWTLSSPIGTLSPIGYSVNFSATTPGKGNLTCSDAITGINSTVYLDVSSGSLFRINITSPTYPLKIPEGETQALIATGYDSRNNTIDIAGAIWYTTTTGYVIGSGRYANFTAGVIPETGAIHAYVGSTIGTLQVEVENAVHGPKLNEIEPQQQLEDVGSWTLNLGLYWSDIDGTSNLRWMVEGVNTTLYFISHDPQSEENVVFYTQPNQNGQDIFTLWVIDELGFRTYREVTVIILAVPDPPLFVNDPPTMLYVKWDAPYTFEFAYYVEDVDTPKMNLTMSASIDGQPTTRVLFDHLTGNYLFPIRPGGNYFEVVSIRVSDGTGYSDLNTVVWVTDDTPPNLNSTLPDKVVQERCVNVEAWDLDDYFYDIDQDDYLIYSSGFQHIVVLPNNVTHIVYISAPYEWSGITEGTLTATDPTGALKVTTVRVIVTPFNNPTEIADIGDVYVKYNQTYVLYLKSYVTDSDNALETLNITLSNSHVTHKSTAGVHRLEFLFPPNLNESIPTYAGKYSVTVRITVSDPKEPGNPNYTLWKDFKVYVTNNSPPSIVDPNQDQYYAFPEDGYLNNTLRPYEIFTDDDDLGGLTYSIDGGTHIHNSITEGIVNLTADPNWFGTEVLTLWARDSGFGWSNVRVYVTVIPINDAPSILPIPDMIVRGGPRSFSYSILAFLFDPDDDTKGLKVNVTPSDPAANVAVVGGVLYVSLPKGHDVITVMVVADDGEAPSNSVSFRVGVSKTIAEMIGWPYSFPLVLLAAGVLGFFIASRLPKPHALENVFLIHNDGRLVSHVTREENTNLDKDVVSAMFTAVQEFVRDSFQKGEVGLKKLEIGDKNVVIEKGENAYLALIYSGWPDKQTFKSLSWLLKDIEERYAGRLEKWNGTQKAVAGVEKMLQEFMSDAFKPGEWHDEEKIADQQWVDILDKET